jgi:hypothetical protein
VPHHPKGFACEFADTLPATTAVVRLDGCAGERDCLPGSGAGCPCAAGGSCAPGFRCNGKRCFSCPLGEKGCACSGGSCNDGLTCLNGIRCEEIGSGLIGGVGQSCFVHQVPYAACQSSALYCKDAQCTTCDPMSGLGPGCECSDSSDCEPGLTCDRISSSCVPCYAECTDKCERPRKNNTADAKTYCPTLGCEACRDFAQCKWCNRAGDRKCVSADSLCPSLYATGDDLIQCGGELLAETFPRKEDLDCNVRTCRGCAMSSACKFCHSNGDWRCVPVEAECPSGKYEVGNLETLCTTPKCGTDCAGHGSCAFDKLVDKNGFELVGRPICTCDADWRPDEKAGCIKLTRFEGKNLRNTQGATTSVFVGLGVALLLFGGLIAFLYVYLRRRARRTVITVDVMTKDANAPLEVKEDGTVQTSDGKVGFKCMFPGCPKAYLTLEDLRNHEQLRHGGASGDGGGTMSGATFNNGATMMTPPAFGSYEQQHSMADMHSAVYDNSHGGGW